MTGGWWELNDIEELLGLGGLDDLGLCRRGAG